MNFIETARRDEVLLLPESLDEYVKPDNPVRFIDEFIEGLDLEGLGFVFPKSDAKGRGRPAYHPKTLLKLLIYGYVNGIRSGRKLERESGRNLELIWLLGKQFPDFKTICDFRRNNRNAFRSVFREFNLLCRKLRLFGGIVVAIDGTKIKGQNNPSKNYTKAKLQKLIKKIDEACDKFVDELEEHDSTAIAQEKEAGLKAKIARLEQEREEYKNLMEQMEKQGLDQYSQTDPDARAMGRGGRAVCGYNGQIAVDGQHALIVGERMTNATSDLKQLSPMIEEVTDQLDRKPVTAVADAGYHHEADLSRCEDLRVPVYVPQPAISESKSDGRYSKEKFEYDAETDTYRCPAGSILTFRTVEPDSRTGKNWRKYGNTQACRNCQQRSRCTTSRHRMIRRSPFADSVEKVHERTVQRPEMMQRRKGLAEHPFGTIKTQILYGGFLVKGLPMVGAEWDLACLAYNLKRVLNILPMSQLVDALRQTQVAPTQTPLDCRHPSTAPTQQSDSRVLHAWYTICAALLHRHSLRKPSSLPVALRLALS